ncbi:CAP domain-containing protein [Lacunisphaera limnophila]|nr:CAP domain-containing protein [Lacunisphaera limnophila]
MAVPMAAELTPEEFVRRPEVQARIDFAAFDPVLLNAAIFHETNRVRLQLGLPAFTHVPELDNAAELKAAIGVVQGELIHENPLPLTATPADRVRAVGLHYRQVAENLARLNGFDLPPGRTQVGVRTREGRQEYYHLDTKLPVVTRTYAGFAEEVVRSWMNSPPHRANIVNPELQSLGCATRPCRSVGSRHEQIYAVQVFFTPR